MHLFIALLPPPQSQESLDLDPRNRHAMVCLAHISCFASASPTTTSQWTPSDERTHELLRVLSLGSSAHFDSIEQETLLRGARAATAAEGEAGSCEWGAVGGGVEAWVLLACAARATGNAGGAVSMFRRALALDPQCLEGWP